MEYNYIVNPKTGRKVKIDSPLGKRIIRTYANEITVTSGGGKRAHDEESPKKSVSKKSIEYLRLPIYMVHDFNGIEDDDFMVELRHGSLYADRRGPENPELFMDKEAFNRLLTDDENDLELVKVYVKDINGRMIEIGTYSTDEVEDYGVAWINIKNDVFRHKKNYPEFWETKKPITFVEKVRDWKTSELIDIKTAEERGLFEDSD